MTTPPARMPSRLAERLLGSLIRDDDWREAVLGDLREEFAERARREGLRPARRWHSRQVVRLVARFATVRPAGRPLPRRPWVERAVELEHARGGWRSDLRSAWRAVAHRPGVSAVIVGTLALALAANATIFNLADALYLRPFRFAGVDRLVIVSSAPDNDPAADRSSVAPADFRDWARESTTLTAFAAAEFWDPNMSGVGEPEQVPGFLVSPGFFRSIGAQPILGRTFVDSEAIPGQNRRLVLSHALWVRRFGSDPGVVGRTVRFDGDPYDVIGVMPPGTALPYGAQVWAPLAYTDAQWAERRRGNLLVLARLADGQSIEGARAEMVSIVERQRRAFPDTHARREFSVVAFPRALADGFAAPILAIWQAAALLLLVIACANIANLLLARGTERQPEFALRLALGAGRGRLARQVLLEGAGLATIAVALTVPLAMAGTELMRRGLPPGIHRWVPGIEFIRVDLGLVGVTALLGLAATLLFSWLPAAHASRAAVSDALRQNGRTIAAGTTRGWLGAGLAASQVALTLTLVVGAGLVLSGVGRAVSGELGFDRTHVMTAQLRLPDRLYAEPEQRRQFVDGVLDRLRAIPAIEALGSASALPFIPSVTRPVYPEGIELSEADVRPAMYQRVSVGYFDTMRIPLLQGRGLADSDRADTTPVAVVSRGFAERYWPGESPIGRRFRTSADSPWLEVVGVSGDVVQDLLLNRGRPTIYRPMTQDPMFGLAFVVRVVGDPRDLGGELRRAIAAVDPELPIQALRTMEQVVAERAGGITLFARALGVMSGIALVLALTGIYSLMAYLASRRTQEIGVRMALGATRWQIVRLSARHAVAITILGLVVGTALAVAIGRVMASVLFGLVSFDALPVAVLAAVIGIVTVAAGVLPARRASNLDPTAALRSE